jgi:hypothetical protein
MKIEYLLGSNIVSLTPARTGMRFPAVAQVEAYWEGLRDGRLMPARSEIDPRGIADALEFAFVLELIAPGLARLRLTGRHLNALLDMEVRGMPFTALFLPGARREIQRTVQIITTRPATARLSLAGDRGLTRPALEAQLYLAPLCDEAGRATRILGALQSQGRIGRAPRRFTVRCSEIVALEGGAPFSAPAGGTATAQHGAAAGLAEQAADFARPTTGTAVKECREGSPHLRLVFDQVDTGSSS